MVLGILIAAITAPGLLGSQEAIRQGQSKDKREEHRARRCNLIASCVKSSPRSREIDGRPVVLRNGKLWIDTTTADGEPFGHTYAGYYLPYPETKYEGLVTTITDVAPIMNWVYIDRDTHEAKYGVRADAQPNLTGPFDCTRQDRRLTFDDWEGWCAVEEYEGHWCLYFDVDDDGLKSKVAPGIRVLEVELSRKEKRFKKEQEARKQDQTTKRAVDTQEDGPLDEPLQADPATRRPGVFNETPSEPEMAPVEGTMPKTPPPAYSKSDKTKTPPTESAKKGAVDALDDLLALESQVITSVKEIRPEGESTPPSTTTPAGRSGLTPKLNRNSGSRAIAQAQKFEAMAAAQKIDNITRMISGSKRVSTATASSFADSASIYSEDGQRPSREIRPQSSVSQRVFDQLPDVSLTPTARSPGPQKVERLESDWSTPGSRPVPQKEQLSDPAIFGAPASSDPKRRSQASSSSQRRLSSRMFIARRSGKRVSPRSSVRKPLTETMSSGAGKLKPANTTISSKAQGGKSTPVNRTKSGRKTTSTFLRDLDDLVSQEIMPELVRSSPKSPAPSKGLPTRGAQKGSNGRAGKGFVRRN
jgi:hypothetical protein